MPIYGYLSRCVGQWVRATDGLIIPVGRYKRRTTCVWWLVMLLCYCWFLPALSLSLALAFCFVVPACCYIVLCCGFLANAMLHWRAGALKTWLGKHARWSEDHPCTFPCTPKQGPCTAYASIASTRFSLSVSSSPFSVPCFPE